MTTLTGKDMIELPFECFDLEKEFDEQVAPLVDTLAAKCRELGLPFICTVACGQERDGTSSLCSSGWMSNPGRTPLTLLAMRALSENEIAQSDTLIKIGALRVQHAAERLKSAH